MHRLVETTRDRIMQFASSQMPLVETGIKELDQIAAILEPIGRPAVSRQWRKPLGVDEIRRMAPTPEVKERKGRP